MLRKKFCDILHKVQQSSSCHQKYRHILIKLYKENTFEDFESEFMRCIERIFSIDIKHKNIHVERCMEFLVTFVTTLATNHGNCSSDNEDLEVHPFLNSIVYNVLEYHKLDQVSARFRSCQFMNLLLRHLGDDAHIDSDIANVIQAAMTERLEDMKTNVRLQAIKALVRLQIPEDVNCPVMNSLMSRLYESSAQVRKEVVESLAVVPTFIPKMIERVRDSDYNVRLSAYKKCSLIGPKLITIANRRLIINSGFTEEHVAVRKVFLEDTLPKWLNIYNGDFVQLLKALKYDAYEEDLAETELISKKVLLVFFKSRPLNDFIEFLPLDDNKVIPVDKLTTELVLFWSILVDFVRKVDTNDEYLPQVIPEMTPFCNYIEKVYEESKNKNGIEWRFLELQQILCQLLKIAKEYDYSDEVGRKKMEKLLHYFLLDGKFSSFVFNEVISILAKINPIFDNLTIDICHIISDIREPLVEKPPSADELRENKFKAAELRVQINILKDDRDTAVAEADYEKASKLKKQLAMVTEQLEKLTVVEPPKQVRTVQDDSDTLCRCLNILIAVLSHPNLTSLTASLRSCKDEFVTPLLTHPDMDVFSKAFKSIALCCLLDEQMIRENMKLICSPIIAYRLMPQYEKSSLFVSIATFSDALRLFGTQLFKNDTRTSLNDKRRLNSMRRLYTTTQADGIDNVDFDGLSCEEILFILVDMLDDENQELRECAARGLCELVKCRIVVSPTIISRLILKWLNPATERCDHKLQQLLANAIVYFARRVKDSEEILEKAIIPILTSLGNAPSTSPLSDVNIDNAVEFLSAITFIQKSTISHNVHKNLAFALVSKIASKPNDRCVSLYTKMLLRLELVLGDDIVVMNELIDQTQLILEDITERNQKRNLEKFVSILIQKRGGVKNANAEGNLRNSLAAPLPATPQPAGQDGVINTSKLETPKTTRNSIPNQVDANNSEHEDGDVTVLRTIIENDDMTMGRLSEEEDVTVRSILRNGDRKSKRLTLKSQTTIERTDNSTKKHKHNGNTENIPATTKQPVKRRKRRGKWTNVTNDSKNESMDKDNMNIESPTSSSTNNSSTDSNEVVRRSLRKVIVSDTSSDSECANKSIRKSLRKKQKTRLFST
ncbi:hypothetical protein FQR65_LT13193 [Abscondita terminalis]|nr:hypothetical protein FQR65_LT13193 [Abscondita terminalis]